jgi:hypothetical protein
MSARAWTYGLALGLLMWALIFVLIGVGTRAFGATEALYGPLPVPPERAMFEDACPDYAGTPLAESACAGHAELWVPKGAGPAVYWHEVGHLFDFQVLTDAHRREFQRLTRDWRDWWLDLDKLPEGYGNGYNPPGERFADAYATCLMQATGRRGYAVVWYGPRGHARGIAPSGYGYDVPYRRHRRVCQLIWNAAGLPFRLPHAHSRRLANVEFDSSEGRLP